MSETGRLEDTVRDLVPRAARGEALALEALLTRCRPVIYRWALVATGEGADADDVTQEVLIKLHIALSRFAGRSRFTTWLYQVTRNEALTLHRRLASRARLREAALLETPAPVATPEPPEPERALEVAALARTFLRELPRRQREVFHLADLEGCSMAEIAERLQINPVTARVHLFQARRALRARILAGAPDLARDVK